MRGLPLASMIKCHEVYTLLKNQRIEQIGRIPTRSLRDVDQSLRVALGIAT